jgi:phosphopantetheinyl transferase
MLDRPPEAVELVIGARGKPALRAPGTPPLFFNMSRSDRFVLVAVGGRELGVDIECGAPRVLHRDGVGDDLDPIERLRRWTRREAVAKAIGIGLAARFRLPLREPTGSVQYGGTLWTWRDLALPPACRAAAALAVREGEPARCG